MLDKILLIGAGAAGNKAAIQVVEDGVIPQEDLLLVNGTNMDVPLNYREKCYVLEKVKESETGFEPIEEEDDGGFGKERTPAKNSTFYALQTGKIPLKRIIQENKYKYAIIVASMEGGSGSGSSVLLAQYIIKACKIPVHVFGFAGFGEGGRGLQNTIEFMQDIDKGVTTHIIKNDSFLSDTNNLKIKSEIAANKEFSNQVKVLIGYLIRESSQNIDSTDRFKTVNTSGYEIVEYKEIDNKIRNKKDFESILISICDESHNMPTSASAKRIAIMINTSQNGLIYCDDYTVLKDRYGSPYEPYWHRQSESDLPDFVAIISSGMKMPIEEVKAIYNKYNEESESVDTSEDEFFSQIQTFKGNQKDSQFDMKNIISDSSEDDFFASYKVTKGNKDEKESEY